MGFAKQAGLAALAITDHDIVEGIPEATAIGNELGIEVVPGVEISSRPGKANPHPRLFSGLTDPVLAERLKTLRSRHLRNPRIVQRLNELGIPITLRRSAGAGWHGVRGPSHIARLLMEEICDLGERGVRSIPGQRPSGLRRSGITGTGHGGPVDPRSRRRPGPCPSHLGSHLGRRLTHAGSRPQGCRVGRHRSPLAPIHQSQTTEYLDLAKQCDLQVTGGSDFHGITKPDIEVGIGRGQLKVSHKTARSR